MGETAEGQDGDSADSATTTATAPSTNLEFDVVDIVPDGDLLLDVTFETSPETLKAARKAAKPRPGQKTTPPTFKAKTRVGYRVQLAVLKQNSKYFDNLLSDTRFSEARSIEASLQQLSLRNVNPSEADAADLPVVKILEDDEATRSAGQDSAFADLLRILHRKQSTSAASAKTVNMQYLAVLAVLADRFDCIGIMSRYLSALKYKWPATQTRLAREDGPALSLAAEEMLRQKILVAWLLDQPPKLHTAARELIMYGSRRWSASFEEGDDDENTPIAAWWDLPDDLEQELHHRRASILSTIASIQQHFLSLYTSRTRQCKLGYESSASCDSYQLGEMVKFLCSKDLLFLTDFTFSSFPSPLSSSSPSSPSPSSSSPGVTDRIATTDIGALLASLKQCPTYQIDKHHTNCGLRTRLLPIVEFVQAMLSSAAVSISRTAWVRDREGTAWSFREQNDGEYGDGDGKKKGGREKKVFRFTRGMTTDQRFRYEGAMAADRMARALFTADEWDWTAEERDEGRGVEFGRWPVAR
ncbi:uncharacterized protein C8A04DRAFT_12952 [Dichotomopilus funicola]|uniref:Uncharacterized protein n=1 Tax=Dichotomopilus funicola TaxID=1934379 RepID=A0AAN6V1K4_9PEZI|nr:hypothetical protein C8A04DRAFT_12952 [Dichotomopilus funicola]